MRSPSAAESGLTPESEFDTVWKLEYPDAETLSRAMVAVAGLARLAGPEREDQLKDAIAFTMLVFILIFRPSGILGERLATKKA